MSMRLMNLIVYLALAVISIVVIRAVSTIPVTMPGDVGSGFFPTVLAWLILICCGIGAIKTALAGATENMSGDYLPRVLITIGVIAVFLFSWQNFGYFYPQCFLFLFGLFSYYRMPHGFSARLLAGNAAIAFGITLVCYVTFTFVVYVDL